MTAERLAAAQRRERILAAASDAFARDGFAGTTTRSLARAAGISEALLYRHFPSKRSLYKALQDLCRGRCEQDKAASSAQGGAELAHGVQEMVRRIASSDRKGRGERERAFSRLMFHSLLEDGAFARQFHRERLSPGLARLETALRAAERAGEVAPGPSSPRLRVLFAHHLAFAVLAHRLPGRPVAEYGAGPDEVERQAAWFALRGLGMKDVFIERHLGARP